MTKLHLVNVWVDREPGPGGFNPMASSLLWLPGTHRIGDPTPAFVFVHRWGGYPYDELARQLGPALSDSGFVVLSVCLARRGMEGQLMAVPDNDVRDIKLAVDFLHTHGCRSIYLAGEEVGAMSALRFQAGSRDPRIKGVALIEPVGDLADWLRVSVGDATYTDAVKRAGVAARQGAGMDTRVDLLPEGGPRVTQNAGAFLAWWSPMADTKLGRSLEDSSTPLLVLTGNAETLPPSLAGDTPPGRVREVCVASRADYAARLAAWAMKLGARMLRTSDVELVTAASAGVELFGLFWPGVHSPQSHAVQGRTAILLMHGLTSSPLSPLFGKMAPVLADAGTAVLAIESQRSGYWGHETALLDSDSDALDAWVDWLLARGFERIVLAGASMGSLSVGRYYSVRRRPQVAAIAHLMPTADCPDWFRRAAGDAAYEQAASQARRAVAEGRGDRELIDIDVRQPSPSLFGARFRWTQRAASWLSWWGPEADSQNTTHIANADVPLLLLSGTDDSYNDEARFAELKAAAVNAPSVDEIWYPDVDHGLAGVEEQVALDLHAWLLKVGVLEAGS